MKISESSVGTSEASKGVMLRFSQTLLLFFPHLLHSDLSTPIVLLLYIQLDTPLYSLAWSYSNIPEF